MEYVTLAIAAAALIASGFTAAKLTERMDAMERERFKEKLRAFEEREAERRTVKTEETPEDREAAEAERKYNEALREGIANILNYDLETALKAGRHE